MRFGLERQDAVFFLLVALTLPTPYRVGMAPLDSFKDEEVWDVLVVGAGIAGLAAARHLTTKGYKVGPPPACIQHPTSIHALSGQVSM